MFGVLLLLGCSLGVHVLVRGEDEYGEGPWRKSLDGPNSCWTGNQ